MAINIIIFFLLLDSALAQDFNFNFYKNPYSNTGIIVNITFDSIEHHDVKVFLHNSLDQKINQNDILSKTLNNETWQNSWNYVKDSFPDISEYKLNQTKDSKEVFICVRLRKVNESKFKELCKKIDFSNFSNSNSSVIENNKIVLNSKIQSKDNIYLSNNQKIINSISISGIISILTLLIILSLSYLRQ